MTLLPGNTNAIDGEIRRLTALRDRLCETGNAVRRLSVDGWAGRSRDAFEGFQQRLATRWWRVGDLHEDAARALERYHATLVELQRRAATTDQQTLTSDLPRWRNQLATAASAAAAAIREATHALDALPRLFEDATPPRTTHTEPTTSNDPTDLDPRTAHTNPAAFRQRVRTLCDRVLTSPVTVVHVP